MRNVPSRPPVSALALGLVLAAAALLAGCGKGAPRQPSAGGGPNRKLAPLTPQGAVSVATRNTTRLGGVDVATDAAAVARTVYPGLTPGTRPQAVVLVDDRDWPAALAASSLTGAPLNAPILYSEGSTLPEATSQTLHALQPLGASALGGAQVIRIATSATLPAGDQAQALASADPATTGAEIEHTLVAADGGKAPSQVIVVSADAPRALTMPAAGLAAESGVPILFVTPTRVPTPTVGVLSGLHRPSIYVIDPAGIGHHTLDELHRFGNVTRIEPPADEAASAAANAIAVARFTDGTFGWGVKEPGHGLVFANAGRPFDGPAAALLSATGDYGPLLLLEAAAQIPGALSHYLGDIKPAYTTAVQPVKGVYNHGWLIGDEAAISAVTQAEIDSLLEIAQRPEVSEEQPVAQPEQSTEQG
jgi:hypothetical protein